MTYRGRAHSSKNIFVKIYNELLVSKMQKVTLLLLSHLLDGPFIRKCPKGGRNETTRSFFSAAFRDYEAGR